MSFKGPQSKTCKSDGPYTEWDIRNAKIIPVPADGLCMYHCVHAAEDPDWMKKRNISGMSLDKYREKEDVEWAQALRNQFVSYLVGKGIHEVAERLATAGGNGYPTTDGMPHLAEMLR